MTAVAPRPGRFLRIADVKAELRLSEPTINRLHRRGDFPPKVHLTERCVGWWESDIEAWKATHPPPERRQ